MDRPYHVIEEEYYAYEEHFTRTGTWKHYESSAFQTIKINIAKTQGSKLHLMMHRKSNYLGIMKVVPSHKSSDARAELNILSSARDCPFMVRLIDGYVSSSGNSQDSSLDNINYYLFFEYAPFRTLDHLTQAIKGVGSANARLYAMEIICALDYLHHRGIMHRDVTPENVFVLLSGHVALGDLGAAIVLDSSMQTDKVCGSYVTRPPEVWNNELYSFPVDVWEFGVTLFNIISNTWPFVHPIREKQINLITAGKLMFNHSFSDSASDLITNILNVQPRLRLKWPAIIKHKYFEELKHPYTPPFTPHELQEMYNFGDEEMLVKELVLQLK